MHPSPSSWSDLKYKCHQAILLTTLQWLPIIRWSLIKGGACWNLFGRQLVGGIWIYTCLPKLFPLLLEAQLWPILPVFWVWNVFIGTQAKSQIPGHCKKDPPWPGGPLSHTLLLLFPFHVLHRSGAIHSAVWCLCTFVHVIPCRGKFLFNL